MAFDLSDYKTVPERIAEAKARYPEGRFQTELLTLPDPLAAGYVAVKARFFRDAEDQTPGEGVAWEVVPGKTPYTKDSELQNAETSAWGRALVAAFAVDASKGIASQEEVRNRQPEPRPRSGGRRGPSTPQAQESHEDAPSAALADVVAGYARDQVAGFSKWSEAERADSYKRHSKALLDGKPVSLEEVDKVVNAMIEEYQARFPGELPI
jgi:hypothetical protein